LCPSEDVLNRFHAFAYNGELDLGVRVVFFYPRREWAVLAYALLIDRKGSGLKGIVAL
jgi:hypothetical protein